MWYPMWRCLTVCKSDVGCCRFCCVRSCSCFLTVSTSSVVALQVRSVMTSQDLQLKLCLFCCCCDQRFDQCQATHVHCCLLTIQNKELVCLYRYDPICLYCRCFQSKACLHNTMKRTHIPR